MATFKTFFGASSAAPRVGTQLDPGKTSSLITLSNGNLTATRSSGAATYATTLSESSALTGNLFLETTTSSAADGAIGVANGPLADDDWLGMDANSIGLWPDGTVYYGGASVGIFTTPPDATDIIAVYVDRTAQSIWFYNVTKAEWLPNDDFGLPIATFGSGPLYFGYTLINPDSKTVNFDGEFAFPGDLSSATRWDGSPITGAAAYTLTAEAGSVALAGQATGLRVARKLLAAPGAIALAGQTAGLRTARKLLAAPGAIVLAGQTAGLRAVRKLLAAPGAIVLTGVDTTLTHGTAARVLVAARGTFVLAGQTAMLRRSYTLAAAKGTFALTGVPANLALRHAYRITADTGLFVLTGNDAILTRVEIVHRTLYAATGEFRLTGAEAFLTSTAPYYPISFASLRNRTIHLGTLSGRGFRQRKI